MECPKCHKNIPDDSTSCPHCRKVLTLVCPNCRTLGQNSVCSNCGYIILEKCSKCGKMVSTKSKKCKCGFPVSTSVAYQECESDEFVSISLRFGALKNIRRILGAQDLYEKFVVKLKNLIFSQLKGFEGNVIVYNNTEFVLNFNKELSLPTAANKAIRTALKILNSFSDLNLKVIEELGTPLKLTLTVLKKNAEELLENKSYENKVKLLAVKKEEKRYLRGMQIIMDEYVQDCVSKDYKTDSLYSYEEKGNSIIFYELLLDSYVLPPNEKIEEEPQNVSEKDIQHKKQSDKDDLYSFNVFDINAKCRFEKANAVNIFNILEENKIVSIRGPKELNVCTSNLVKFFESKGKIVLRAVCTEETMYKPWGVLGQIFADYYKISPSNIKSMQNAETARFNSIINLLSGIPRQASTPEDARFAYMEDFAKFLSTLRNYVILIEGFENIDDTTVQTLLLYFDKFQKIVPNFIFVTNRDDSVHSKFKGLVQSSIYTEVTLLKSGIENLFSQLSEDASDFIQSFYYEKIEENYRGSAIYFDNAIKFLKEKDILISFENKLLIKNNNSVVLPTELSGLIRSRLKHLSKNPDASMILAYSIYLGPRLDFNLLKQLEINDVEKNAKILEDRGFAYIRENNVYINNYDVIKLAITSSIKKETEEYLIKNIFKSVSESLDNTTKLLLLGKLSRFDDEYKLLWKNSQFSMSTGDYDAYLKNCLGSLSLIEQVKNNISKEEIDDLKKEVFQNILMNLYSYSPEKIYSIENILLIDAMKQEDNEKIVKLSNMMLQGALISANYTDALALLHNILSRMKNPTLIVDGAVNTKFLLLSLVNIEILFNIGDYKGCVESAEEVLKVIKPNIIEKIKPAGFSTSFFAEHLFDTFRIAGFAKIIKGDFDSLDAFFEAVELSMNAELPDKDALIAIKDYLAGKDFVPSQTEEAPAFSKIIYLILQEFSEHKNDYKSFAKNIYQAKLLAADLHQAQLEIFCDLLIGYAYAQMGIGKKAMTIYRDILDKSERNAIYNTIILSKYFIALLKISESDFDEAVLLINDALASIKSANDGNKIMYVLFEKLFIELIENEKIPSIDSESEKQKLSQISKNGELSRILTV